MEESNKGDDSIMRKYRSAYLKPYIRKARKDDFNGARANDLRTAIIMGIIEGEGHKAYILVQRGSSGIITIARSRRELKKQIVPVAVGKMTFKEWANSAKFRCRK